MSSVKYDVREKPNIIRTLIVLIYIASFILCIWFGIAAGNYLYETDGKAVMNLDAASCKKIVASSFPIIDITYNKGKAGSSISNEIMAAFQSIFGFNPERPLTILNVDSSHYYYYYSLGYLPYINEQREKARENEKKLEITHVTGEGINSGEDINSQEYENSIYSEAASSISFDEDEGKDRENSEEISKGSIAILNETDYSIDIDKLLSEPLNIRTNRNGPRVLIFHTHTTESYLQKLDQLDNDSIPSWSRDNRKNVVRVGEELAQILRNQYNIEVIHNDTVHDYPSYNNSYSNSLKTVSSILKSYPSLELVIDIHRDAVGTDKPKLRVVSEIEGKKAAKVMFVVGTDSARLPHPNWKENLKLAVKLQHNLNLQCSGLARHIYISENRYNHHLSKGALIIEVGGDGNTVDEALVSTKYIARAISTILNE
jgi:stage II sporulation protein P